MPGETKTEPRKLEVRSCSWIDPKCMVNVFDSTLVAMDGLIAIVGTWLTAKRWGKPKRELTEEQERALEKIDRTAYWLAKGRNTPWTNLAAIGLAMTDNTEPPESLDEPNEPWVAPATPHYREYRAMVTWRWERGRYVGGELDPGWTPPMFDTLRAKERYVRVLGVKGLDTLLMSIRHGMLSTAVVELLSKYWPGEKSQVVSRVETGRVHPNSYLRKYIEGGEVLVNAIIKFRAGWATNMVGTSIMRSPYHIPWVWCEHALVKKGNRFRLYIAGSKFPSHTLYVNGRKMGTLGGIKMTGTPSDTPLLRGARVENADFIAPPDRSDEKAGAPLPIDVHPYTVKPNEDQYLSFDVTKWIEETEDEEATAEPEKQAAMATAGTVRGGAGFASLSSASRNGRIRSEGKLAVTDPPKIVTEPSAGATWDGKGTVQVVEKRTGRICVGGSDVLCKSLGFVAVGCSDSAGGTCFGQGMIEAPKARRARGKGEGMLLADDEGTCKGTILRSTGPPGKCECIVRLEVED